MSGSLNKVQIIGTLGRDPEVRSFQNGGKVCNLSVACSESWKDKHSGEKKEKTEWVSVAIFNDGLVGVAERYLKKGSKVYVEGKLQTRKWQDRDGNDRYTTEVVLQGFGGTLLLLGDPKSGSGSGSGGGSSRSGGAGGSRDRQDSSSDGGWGGGSGGGTSNRGSAGGGSGSSWADDLDDDIPFVTADPAYEWKVS